MYPVSVSMNSSSSLKQISESQCCIKQTPLLFHFIVQDCLTCLWSRSDLIFHVPTLNLYFLLVHLLFMFFLPLWIAVSCRLLTSLSIEQVFVWIIFSRPFPVFSVNSTDLERAAQTLMASPKHAAFLSTMQWR